MKQALTITEVTQQTGIGRTKLYEFIKTGRLRAVKADGSTKILPDDLQNFLASLPAWTDNNPHDHR